MDDLMIEAEGLGMRFDLGLEKSFSVKQAFIDCFDPSKKARKRSRAEFWALRDLSFRVHRGEVLGFVGANGAGKSTLLKLAAGVLKPSEGQLRVHGSVCPMIELGAGLDPELTARENIFLNAALMGYPERFILAKFDEIVAFSELEAFLDVPVRNFSSGMTARLAFSVATVVEPEILIVDEILSVGDLAFQTKSEKKMLQMIRGGTTVLFVSHSTASIRALCGRAAWLERGRLREIGGADEVCLHYERSALPRSGEDAASMREEEG